VGLGQDAQPNVIPPAAAGVKAPTMPGWNHLPADADTDWTLWLFRAQFADAVRERKVAIGWISPDVERATFSKNIDAHAAGTLDWLDVTGAQSEIENMLAAYLRPANMASQTHVPNGYPRFQFWADLGTPAEAKPTEDLLFSGNWFPPDYYGTTEGQRYAVTAYSATGAWAGHAGDIATAHLANWEVTWAFETPADKYIVAVGGTHWTRKASIPDWVQTIRIGWTRKRPREIARTTDDGEAGQRARLAGTGHSENDQEPARMYGVAADPPTDPTPGITYGVQKDATGAWEGHGGDLAVWAADPPGWTFTTPTDGRQYLFNTVAHYAYGYAVRLRNCRAWIHQGGQWQGTGDIYEYGEAGWTRAQDQTAPPDLETTYGQAEAGDFVGPWLWNELQAALRLLHLSRANGSGWGGNSTEKWAGGSGWQSSQDLAHAAALAAWTAKPLWQGQTDFGPWNTPHAYNLGESTSPTDYAALGERWTREQRLEFYGGDPALTVDVAFYVIGRPPSWSNALVTFAAHGDPVALTATAWYTMQGQSNVGPYTSPQWGQADLFPAPPWADPDAAPPDYQGRRSAQTGYVVTEHFGTKEHTRPGGFTYQ
jgi:hypothetical protein